MSYGYNLGNSYLANKLSEDNGKLVEGVHSANSINLLANKLNIDMPICKAVNDVIYNRLDLNEAVLKLLKRPLKDEL